MQGFPFDSQLTFDSDNLPVYDRAISSQPLRKLIRDLFTTGVMPNPSTNLQVSSGTDGMTVQVQAGFAVVDGGLCQETETRTLEITAADTTYDRIDTIVLRWNENVDARTADLYVVAGTPSATPVRPTLQRDNSIYEIGLADVFITKRVATITDDKITDTRYEAERCGIVSSVSEWDTTTIYQQVQADLAGFKSTEQAEFMTWFDTIKDILDSETAGHLQGEIEDLDTRLDSFENAIEAYTNGIGTTSIKNIGDGTITGAISGLNTSLSDIVPQASKNTQLMAVGIDVLNGSLDNNRLYFVSVPISTNCPPQATRGLGLRIMYYTGGNYWTNIVYFYHLDGGQMYFNAYHKAKGDWQGWKKGFKSGAIYLGQYSANTTIDVSDLGATSVDQFLITAPTAKNSSTGNTSVGGSGTVSGRVYYNPPTLSLSGNTLTVNVGNAQGMGIFNGNAYVTPTATIYHTVKVYFVGDIETR